MLKNAGGEFVDVTDVDEPGEGEVDIEEGDESAPEMAATCSNMQQPGCWGLEGGTDKVYTASVRSPK